MSALPTVVMLRFFASSVRGVFFCFVSRLLGVVYAADSKKNVKKHTDHERVQFWGTTEHERGPYTHATRQKHTLDTRGNSFEYH